MVAATMCGRIDLTAGVQMCESANEMREQDMRIKNLRKTVEVRVGVVCMRLGWLLIMRTCVSRYRCVGADVGVGRPSSVDSSRRCAREGVDIRGVWHIGCGG